MHIIKNIASGLRWANTRTFFGALNIIFNRVSPERIKEVGPDRACAEWLMRNGALIRWLGYKDFVPHYNSLPLDPAESGIFHIEEVNATEASITHHGFDHFVGCEHVQSMTFDKCWYFDDKCIQKLSHVSTCLQTLQITRCGEVTDSGLMAIAALPNIRRLSLKNLVGVKDINKCVDELKVKLPQCLIGPAELQNEGT